MHAPRRNKVPELRNTKSDLNYHIIRNTLRALLTALFVTGLAAQAQAGPGYHQSFIPITTMKEARAIAPGLNSRSRAATAA